MPGESEAPEETYRSTVAGPPWLRFCDIPVGRDGTIKPASVLAFPSPGD